LYTARGSQGVGVGDLLAKLTNTDPSIFNDTFLLQFTSKQGNKFHEVKPIFTLKNAPGFTMTDKIYDEGAQHQVLISIPMLCKYANIRVDEIPFTKLIVKPKYYSDVDEVKEMQ
jgi:hypothetical protein